MNMFSWIMLMIIGVVCASGYLLLFMQSMRAHRQIQQLQKQLDVFVDSSINVARSVDQLVHHGDGARSPAVSSRRWILQEAKSRLGSGEDLLDIAAPLGLSKDEIRLLNAQIH